MEEQNRRDCSTCAYRKFCLIGSECVNDGYKYHLSEEEAANMTKIEGIKQ
jgi:hypothetical protein